MATPFARALVPYDGSEPSEAALRVALALGTRGTVLDLVHVVDETPLVTQSSAEVVTFDPTPIAEAMEEQGRTLLAEAAARCRAAGVEATTDVLVEMPVPGILRVAEERGDALIVMGTHGREGLPRMLHGSASEGVLRASTIPLLLVRAEMAPASEGPFARLVVAVDHSDPADAAAQLAGAIAAAYGSVTTICSVVDPRDIEERATTYGYDPGPLLEELRAQARAIVERARARGGFPAHGVFEAIDEGDPGETLVAQAHADNADAIVIGSHGRRGLQRLLLGSVAEYVVRHSPVPVLVVRRR